jgi:hypothetical protein
MTNKPKLPLYKLVIRGVVIGTMVASRAAASIITPALSVPGSDDDAVDRPWSSMRDRLDATTPQDRTLNPDIVALVRSVHGATDREHVMRVSYAMASQAEFAALDELWVEVLLTQAGPEAVKLFLAVRSQIDIASQPAVMDGDAAIDSWIWRVQAGGDTS